MERNSATLRGRGAGINPTSRFERLTVLSEEAPASRVATEYLADTSRSVIARNNSPDIPFDASLNPYRGCEHGCAYCYARPSHEYLGMSAGIDFESRILVKEDAPELLRRELASPRWTPQVLALSGVTDAYQPVEEKLGLTRRCLEVLVEARNPVVIVTKSARVTRDIDLLAELAMHRAAAVCLSTTTLDGDLARRLEPRASHPRRRLAAVEKLTAAGIPCSVLMSPLIPALTDHEIPALLQAAKDAGAVSASYLILRLPGAVAPLFEDWLTRNVPDRREKVLNRIRALRGGRLNDPRFGMRFRGQGPFADQIRTLFHTTRKRLGLDRSGPKLSTQSFRKPVIDQLPLFDF
ncbi:MAG: PA0069 family radical SAM protein [Acidobacteriota bacterium]